MSDAIVDEVERVVGSIERLQKRKEAKHASNPRYSAPDQRISLLVKLARTLSAENHALRAQVKELKGKTNE